MRYFLEIAYNGTAYHGWQIQSNTDSIQARIQKMLSTLLRENIEITGSGRTDAGVHATQQFAHFDVATDLMPQKRYWLYKFNKLLPHDIRIKNLELVISNAHARHDAISRSYIYQISAFKQPFATNNFWYLLHDLDLDKMNQAAELLLKYEDFGSFCKYHSSAKHHHCTITEATWKKEGEFTRFYITANRFLYGMVRAIVGTLVEVGIGKLSVIDFEQIILQKDRKAAKNAAPPAGLSLVSVKYEPEIFTFCKS
jgi:tRNA pseudouridine38-40 synthase